MPQRHISIYSENEKKGSKWVDPILIRLRQRQRKKGVMVFSATFNNCSVISWWSVLLVEETGVPGETTNLSDKKKKEASEKI